MNREIYFGYGDPVGGPLPAPPSMTPTLSPEAEAYTRGYIKGYAPGPFDPPPVNDPVSNTERMGYEAGRARFHADNYPPNPQGHVYPLDTSTLKQFRQKLQGP